MSALRDALLGLNRFDLVHMSDDQFRALAGQVLEAQQDDRRENQILAYKPVSDVAVQVHRSTARYVCIGGGNGASKTETALAHVVQLATGMFSEALDPITRLALRTQFRGPINVRVVVESLTTTLGPIILPKLQWWKWSGFDEPGGERGHWGWVPRKCLVGGSWARAWSEKPRVLRVFCFDPDNPDKILGESMFQFMAHNQDPSDFASGDFHHVIHDEPPLGATWRENEARTMRVGGKMWLAMTWPDNPAIPIDWIYDTLYEPGRPGPSKVANIDWFEMWTVHNPHLAPEYIEEQRQKWEREGGTAVLETRLYGRPIRFSNRVHALFTNHEVWWCRECKETSTIPAHCLKCGALAHSLVRYCHVQDFPHRPFPTIFLLDPHPRKPHMGLWVQVDTWDNLWVVAECVVPGGPDDVMNEVRRIETELGLNVVARVGDAKMLGSPSGAKRDVTWRDEFDAAGLALDLSDSSDVGRARVDEYLRVDPDREQPRLHFHPRCTGAIRQMLRFVWDDFVRPEKHDQKQKTKEKDDDFPALLRYCLNLDPRFQWLSRGAPILKTRG